jgi:hypothetical protein
MLTLENLEIESLDDMISIEIAKHGMPLVRKKIEELIEYMKATIITMDQTEEIMQNKSIKKKLDEAFERMINLDYEQFAERLWKEYEIARIPKIKGLTPIIHDGETFIRGFCESEKITEKKFWAIWEQLGKQRIMYMAKIPQRQNWGMTLHWYESHQRKGMNL